MALAAIGQDVQAISKKLGLSSDLSVLEPAWNVELGRLREFARIKALDNDALVIEVDSHPVMQELSLRRRELITKVNKHLPEPMIRHMTLNLSHGR